MRRAALLALVTQLACATTAARTHEGFRATIALRIGQPVDNLLRDRGAPTSSVTLTNGNLLLEWNGSGLPSSGDEAQLRSSVALGAFGASMNGGPNYAAQITASRQWTCMTRYEVDATTMTIIAVRFEGNGCTAPMPRGAEKCTEFAHGDGRLYRGCMRELAARER